MAGDRRGERESRGSVSLEITRTELRARFMVVETVEAELTAVAGVPGIQGMP